MVCDSLTTHRTATMVIIETTQIALDVCVYLTTNRTIIIVTIATIQIARAAKATVLAFGNSDLGLQDVQLGHEAGNLFVAVSHH